MNLGGKGNLNFFQDVDGDLLEILEQTAAGPN
jgi:hypothetical protein